MGYMKAMFMDIQDYLENHPDEKIAGKTIHIEVDTYQGKKWVDYVLTEYDVKSNEDLSQEEYLEKNYGKQNLEEWVKWDERRR